MRIFATAIFAALLVGGNAPAQPMVPPTVGLGAGDWLVRLRAIGVIPENSSSSVSLIGGHVDVSNTPAPEVDLSYFFTDHLAAELIAASTRHKITAVGTALGEVPVGTTYILPPTLTLQYHLFPRAAFNPYVGVGVTAAFWYDTTPAAPTITKLGLRTAFGPAVQAGFDCHIAGNWFFNFDIKQVFLNVDAHLNSSAIVAKTELNPTVIGAGIGLRF